MVDYKPLKRFPGTRRDHDHVIRSVCQECTVRCGILAYVMEGLIVDVQGDENHPISRGRLCARGTAFAHKLKDPDRIMFPGTRNRLAKPFKALDNTDKALDLLAERLGKARDQHGPETLYIGCDPEAGQDFLFGAMRFARAWGTPHVYHPLDEPEMSGNPSAVSPIQPCSEWIQSRCLFLIEADLATTHPVAFGWVLDAQKQGTKVIAADSRFTTTMSKADMSFIIKPESGNSLGIFLMKLMLDGNLHDPEAVSAGLTEPDQWKASFDKMPLEHAEKTTGLSLEISESLSRLLGYNSPVTLITGKRLAYDRGYGIWLTMATAMGWTRLRGGGWYALESGRPAFNQYENLKPETRNPNIGTFPYQAGKKTMEPAEDLNIRAMICSGNCFEDFFIPIRNSVQNMDIVAYFGAFPNTTRDLSHMFFPGTLWPEKNGLCFSNDRAMQWRAKIAEPAGACQTGLDFWAGLARRFGWDDCFPWKKESGLADQAAFCNWLLEQNSDTAGCDADFLKESGSASRLVFWPVKKDSLTETRKTEPVYGPDSFTAEPDDENYPLYFQGTRTVWAENPRHKNDVQINPRTARAIGIENGDEILVSGPGATLQGHAWISRAVPEKVVWAARRLGENRVKVCKKGL